ncbi:MAG: thioredoxin domain-containing protein [Solirubrobacteraceae bacterium]
MGSHGNAASANRLAYEASPYLRQHMHNPVDWFPWGREALALARETDRPLLVSIGYSACHWCHVMAHESFEDVEIAALMNDNFVCVKVDREERPDVDAICMEACQRMTGQGGWPLNTFLTPQQTPFFAGTYFPPQARHGLPSWRMVLEAIADAWGRRRSQVVQQAEQIARVLGATARIDPAAQPPDGGLLSEAVEVLRARFDAVNGGWGTAPKFPQASTIEFLLARGERDLALAALRAMAAGGIYDQVGGGFARYAVDATWTVPHFEKMLYDNALLARAYLHGWQVSGEERLRRVCCETLDWALREMRGEEGGFCAALDADSEGVEGRFYVWDLDELRAALGDRELADEAVAYFGVSVQGNFEHGHSVLEGRGPQPARLPEIRCKLYGVRAARVRPGLDDKRLTSWNALMIAALADAGAVLQRTDYLEAARACAAFVLHSLRDERGQLLRTWKDGQGRVEAYLEDHAFLLDALLVLYEATFEERWYREAVALADTMIARFSDPERGGFFTTAADREQFVARRKDLDDMPIPSGNSAAAFALLRLARLSGEDAYERHAEGVLRLLAPLAADQPLGFAALLRACDFHLASVREVAIVGDDASGAGLLADAVRARLRPHIVLAGGPAPNGAAGEGTGAADAGGGPDERADAGAGELPGAGGGVPLLAGRGLVDGRAAAYVCEHFACLAPVTDVAALEQLLAPGAGGGGGGA